MASILVVQSSAREVGSYTRLLVDEFVELLARLSGPHEVVLRDLVRHPVPVLHEFTARAIRTPPDQLSEDQKAATALSDELIAELFGASLVVVGVPMYNWSIPAAFKAYLDQVMRVGRTFEYSAKGVEGLLGGKPAVVILARGGGYDSPERALHDFQKPYLENVLTVIGLKPTFVTVENTLRGEALLEPSLEAARTALRQLATMMP